jgi:hypothetical protein
VSELARIIANAREERCLLRDRWDEADGLPGRDQLTLMETLMSVKPATITKGGRLIPCEPRFRQLGARLADRGSARR